MLTALFMLQRAVQPPKMGGSITSSKSESGTVMVPKTDVRSHTCTNGPKTVCVYIHV